MSSDTSYRLGWLLALASALFLVLGIGALGIVGAGGEADRLYAAVLVVGVVGAVVARLRARGMAITLAAMAATTLLVALIAILTGHHHDPGASMLEILAVSSMYAALFTAAGWLFSRASLGPSRAG